MRRQYTAGVDLIWHERPFVELSSAELYAIVELRERVFVVEQNCVYLDADGFDVDARHIWAARDRELHAYLRVLPAGSKYAEASIGRVIVAPVARGTGLGRELMRRGILAAGAGPIRIGAQAYLERFYRELGFEAASPIYVEDGIDHLEMIRRAAS
jgi:ElaA protein